MERLVYPKIGDMPIASIRRKAIVALLDKVEDGSGATMAHMTLAVIRRIMSWHATRDENYASADRPRDGRITPQRAGALADIVRRRVARRLEDGEERADPFAAMVRFLLLTAARRTEAAAMTWNEIDGADWLLPAARNKVSVDLCRPLSKAARELLDARPRIDGCPYVFTYGTQPARFRAAQGCFRRASAASPVGCFTICGAPRAR